MIRLPGILRTASGEADWFRILVGGFIILIGLVGASLLGDMFALPESTVAGQSSIEQYIVDGAPEIVAAQAGVGGMLLVLSVMATLLLILFIPIDMLVTALTKSMKSGLKKNLTSVIPALVVTSAIVAWLYITLGDIGMWFPAVFGVMCVLALVLCFIQPWVDRLEGWQRRTRIKAIKEGITYREEQLERMKEKLLKLVEEETEAAA